MAPGRVAPASPAAPPAPVLAVRSAAPAAAEPPAPHPQPSPQVPPRQLAPPPSAAPSPVPPRPAGPTPPPPDPPPAARTYATPDTPAPAHAPPRPTAHPHVTPVPRWPDRLRRAAPAPPDPANHPPGCAPPTPPPRPARAAEQTAVGATPEAELRGPSRGASRRGGGSGGLVGLSRTSAIRQSMGTSGRGAMSQVVSALMTLVSTPAYRATPRRCREGLIRSAAPRRGATTGTLPAMSASPWSRSIITPGSRHIAGTRLAPRAALST